MVSLRRDESCVTTTGIHAIISRHDIFMPRKSIPKTLRLYLLGAFQAQDEKGEIDGPARKLQAVLAYLLLNPGEHGREKLAALFWGDSSDTQARDSLRTALKILRKHFGEELLLADRESVEINREFSLWVDAREFQAQANADFEAAIALYRGDLLAGFYDDWILQERERLRALYLHALTRASVEMRTRGEAERAIAYAQKILSADATNEDAHRQLMLCHVAMGNRNAALKQYEECVRVLHAELDVEPSPETTALFQELKHAATETLARAKPLTNVLKPLTSFVGRAREMDQVKNLIQTERLVTLTGAGGTGKTRLATHFALTALDDFQAGVWWVELAGMSDPVLVPQAVANALGVHQVTNQPIADTVALFLYAKQLLLVLDNCKHLIDACAQFSESLLRACPSLKILATSREALDILGEQIYHVPTLSLPASIELPLHQVLEHEATCLFIERALAVKSDFALDSKNALVITQICQQLDGIPLAIELAAARVKILSPQEIALRLDDRFALLTLGSRTVLPRHQTLRATIDWSFNLLTETERSLFRRLSVFAGGFTLDAAKEICAGEGITHTAVLDLLAHVVDKSLVIVNAQAIETRYHLLETIREYAREKLEEDGAAAQVRNKHLEYFVGLAEKAKANAFGAESVKYFKRLDQELDNIRAAMDWTIQTHQAIQVFRLATALNFFWAAGFYFIGSNRSSVGEWERNLIKALSLPEGLNRSAERAKALNALGFLPWSDQSPVNPRHEIDQALSIGRELGDTAIVAQALCNLGLIENVQGNYAHARSLLQQGLELLRELGPEGKTEYIWALIFLGDVAMNQDDLNGAQMFYAECATILGEIQDRNFRAYPARRLGQLALHRGEFEKAFECYRESLEMNLELGDERAIIACVSAFAGIVLARGELMIAAQLFGAVQALINARNSHMLQIDHMAYERNVSTLRSQLDSASLEIAWRKGADMTIEHAIDFAFSNTIAKNPFS